MENQPLSRVYWKNVVAAWSGWVMDGYVTSAYALVTVTVVSRLLMPPDFGLVGALFGLALISVPRIFGSLIFGNFLGDRLGRRTMLTVTVVGFSLSSFLIGFLPTYKSYGILATALLFFLLILVGLFAGAEYGGGTALATESVPAEKRGFIGSFVQSGFGIGYFVVTLVYIILTIEYPGNAFETIGWRILFFTTLIPGIIALVSRLGAKESPVFKDMKETKSIQKEPVVSMFRDAPKYVVLGIIICAGLLLVNSGTISFYPTVMESNSISITTVGYILLVANGISLAGVWIGGLLSNYIPGRRLALLIYSSIFLVSIYPLTILGTSFHSITDLYISYSVQSFLMAAIFSTLPSFLAESISKKFRTTGIGFIYNFGGAIGGFAPLFIELVIPHYGTFNSWILVLFVATLALLVAIILSKETWSKSKSGQRDSITE